MNIGISTEGIERANAVLKHIKGAFPRVLASTTNRVLEGMRTDIVAETKERYFVKPSEIRKTISLKRPVQTICKALCFQEARENLLRITIYS